MAALNFILNCRVMEQSGADENYIGGIFACLGAQNTIQICCSNLGQFHHVSQKLAILFSVCLGVYFSFGVVKVSFP